jgi:hypothetical protein
MPQLRRCKRSAINNEPCSVQEGTLRATRLVCVFNLFWGFLCVQYTHRLQRGSSCVGRVVPAGALSTPIA